MTKGDTRTFPRRRIEFFPPSLPASLPPPSPSPPPPPPPPPPFPPPLPTIHPSKPLEHSPPLATTVTRACLGSTFPTFADATFFFSFFLSKPKDFFLKSPAASLAWTRLEILASSVTARLMSRAEAVTEDFCISDIALIGVAPRSVVHGWCIISSSVALFALSFCSIHLSRLP